MAASQHRLSMSAPRYVWIGLGLALVLAIVIVGAALIFGSENKGGITVSEAWVRATVPQTDAASVGTGDSMSGMAGMGPTATPGMDMASGDMAASESRVTGAFMTLTNQGSEPERLVQVAVSPEIAGAVEIHETTIDDNDVMRMRPVDGIDVPANGSTALQPGGYHIMLLDVQRDLNPGDTVSLTLTFQSGKTVTVAAPVRALE